jgi:hypothetical protein
MKKPATPKGAVKVAPSGTSGLSLNLLLILQAVYCLAGIGYNVISLILSRTGGTPLSATNPVTGMIVMAVYGGCLVVGALRYVRIYRVLMALSLLVFGYGGVIVHVMNFAADRTFLYSSMTAWAVAIGINVFGLVLNLVAALGFFSDAKK